MVDSRGGSIDAKEGASLYATAAVSPFSRRRVNRFSRQEFDFPTGRTPLLFFLSFSFRTLQPPIMYIYVYVDVRGVRAC